MNNILSKALKTDFVSNISKIVQGTIQSQLVLVLVSPLLTRIYSPEEYAVYAIFVSVSSVLYVSSTGRYELALMLPKSNGDAKNLLFIALILPILFSLLIVAPFLFLNFLNIFNWKPWVFFLPLSIILYAWNVALLRWASRHKSFHRIGRAKVYYAVVMSATQILFGIFLNIGYTSLIAGQLLGHAASIAIYFQLLPTNRTKLLKEINLGKLIYLLRKYSKFPIYLGPSGILSFASSEIPTVLIFYIFSAEEAAFYALSRRVLSMPMSFVGSAIGEVFFQRISEHTSNTRNSNRILLVKTWVFLFTVAVIPMLIIFIYAEDMFSFIFGAEWRQSGKYAVILAPFLLVQFCVWPTRMLLQVKSSQIISFVWFATYLISIIIIFSLTAHYKDQIFTMICYSSLSVAAYLIYAFLMYYFSSDDKYS